MDHSYSVALYKEHNSVNIWYLYLVDNCLGQLYTGITTDVARRVLEHQNGGPKGAKALKGKAPISLKWSTPVGNRSQASKAEYWVKQLTRNQKMKLVAGLIELPHFD